MLQRTTRIKQVFNTLAIVPEEERSAGSPPRKTFTGQCDRLFADLGCLMVAANADKFFRWNKAPNILLVSDNGRRATQCRHRPIWIKQNNKNKRITQSRPKKAEGLLYYSYNTGVTVVSVTSCPRLVGLHSNSRSAFWSKAQTGLSMTATCIPGKLIAFRALISKVGRAYSAY